MNSVKISIIIPVYNAEKTLCRCIDSILAQSLAEFEAIFVDDCSTDGSAAIIAEYARRDARIRLVSLKKNGGAGNARNVGIEHARGDYLSFVDSDDTIAPDFLELLFKKAGETKAEVVRGAHLTIIGNDFNNAVSVNKMHHQNELYEKAIKDRRKRYILFKSAHFAAIYRRAFIMDNAIRYGKTVVSEDSTFLVKILTLVRSVAFERNAPEHLAKMSLLVRAIVEYGADLAILPSTGSAESPEMYLGGLERTVALLRIHPQAARVYFDYADFLSKRLFALALSMLLSDPSKAATIFDALFIVCNELNGIKEKRKVNESE